MKFNRVEKDWLLYDVANSAFVLILSATIPVYFRSLAEGQGVSPADATSMFALSTSIAVILVAILAPILGRVADQARAKKSLFIGFLLMGVLGGLAFTITNKYMSFIVFLLISRIGYSMCNVFYDSMLTDVTTDDRMDQVSAAGYAWGYVYSTIPFILGLGLIFIKPFGMDVTTATKLSFVITMLWWIGFSIPLLKNYKQVHFIEEKNTVGVFEGLINTLGKIYKNKQMLYFILAYFCYIDGVYTIISQSTNFGGEVGISTQGMVIALLFTQFVAFPFAILSGKLAKKYGQIKMLIVYIFIYMIVAVVGFFMSQTWHFWLLAFLVGVAQGGIQAISRSYFGQLVPKEESNEYFGFFDIFGKFADFMGPLFMVASAELFNTSKYGILALIILFILGIVFLKKVREIEIQKGA